MAHSPEVRAQAMAALMTGQGVREVAKEYSLPKTTVSKWKAEISEVVQEVSQKNGTQKTRDFGDMLGNYLEELLTTAIAQQRHFRDKDWLSRQHASDLAVLHGVSIDKGIRLFEAANQAGHNTQGS
jgi:hypothetical protein